ncbi:MAG: hypothetical protein JOZ90_06475 [Alphaproteobacteria bacterium]|nr:hypothetical protein [Alphaproteobacteria bacterium]MBV9370052.1 hypothetical protein [Alphaproteobacteria bacterium]MBV9900726.1 hypothetical protein [Alphaproteobacteria bacterium]
MLRISFLLIALAAAAAPAAAPADPLGKRTAEPEKLLSGIGEASSDAALEAEIAAAAAFPLGSLANPVRVGGPEGERAYVRRLRCADGKPPRIGDRRPGGVGAFGSLVDLFPLDCGAAAPGRVELMMDMYFEEQAEQRAPAGFTLAPR